MKLLTMQNMASLVGSCTQVTTSQTVDKTVQQHHSSSVTGPAAGEMSLESSMTDDDSGRAEVVRSQRLRRRHRGSDDVFPTNALQRYHVC